MFLPVSKRKHKHSNVDMVCKHRVGGAAMQCNSIRKQHHVIIKVQRAASIMWNSVTRRRGASMNAYDDEIELVKDEDVSVDVPSSRSSTPSPSLTEENHVTKVPKAKRPSPLKLLKSRLVQSSSPKGRQIAWWITVAVLFVLAVLLVSIPLILEDKGPDECSDFEEIVLGEDYEEFPFLYRGAEGGTFELCREGKSVLSAKLGLNHNYDREVKVNVYNYSSETVLNITRHPGKSNNCLRIEWVGLSSQDRPLKDCFEVGDAHWFGAYEFYDQSWPLQRGSLPEKSPFLPHDFLEDHGSNSFGSVLHPLWVSSNGVGLLVDEGVQMYVTISNETNTHRICLHAQPFELECAPKAFDRTFFNYSVCTFPSVAEVTQYFLNEHVAHPLEAPPDELFQDPVWTTWPHLQTVDDDVINMYITNISGLGISQLAINNSYSRNNGRLDLQVNAKDLEVPLVGAWLHPFVPHTDSDFNDALVNEAFLPGTEDLSVTLVKWWETYGAIINVLNNDTARHHGNKLDNFTADNGLHVLKFDGGQFTVLPKCVLIEGLSQPGNFTKSFVQFVAARRPPNGLSEVRVGFFTQDQPVLIQLLDRKSTWDQQNGLRSVLNAVLALGIGGYPFVVPGTVGGIGASQVKDEELYIRWMQLNTFLPFMQFSVPPSSISQKAGDLATRLVDMRRSRLSHVFIRLAQNATVTGHPIIRPLWWLSDIDSTTVAKTEQFLIGDDLMVVPILEPRVYSCQVYFPRYTEWRVEEPEGEKSKCTASQCANGSTQQFNVPLDQVLYFSRVRSP